MEYSYNQWNNEKDLVCPKCNSKLQWKKYKLFRENRWTRKYKCNSCEYVWVDLKKKEENNGK